MVVAGVNVSDRPLFYACWIINEARSPLLYFIFRILWEWRQMLVAIRCRLRSASRRLFCIYSEFHESDSRLRMVDVISKFRRCRFEFIPRKGKIFHVHLSSETDYVSRMVRRAQIEITTAFYFVGWRSVP